MSGRRVIFSEKFCALALMVLLTIPAPAFGLVTHGLPTRESLFRGLETPRGLAQPDPYVENLPRDYYLDIPFDNQYDSSIQLRFQVVSNVGVDVDIMTQSEFISFSSSGFVSSIYHSFGTSVTGSASLPSGATYYLVVLNDVSQGTATVQVSASTVPVDIYELYSGPPSPVGVADYGVKDSAGVVTPYELTTDGVVANAKIYSLGAYNATPPAHVDPDGASLQLNVVLEVNTTKSQYSYWVQNVLTFRTSLRTAYFQSEIFNESSPTASLNGAYFSGRGRIYRGSSTSTYIFSTPASGYALPYFAQFVTSETQSGGVVTVRFGYDITESGTPMQGPMVYYDTVTISEPGGASSSGIVVDGYKTNPFGSFYDAEFVFGGEGASEATTFTQMNAILSMFYQTSGSAQMQPKSLYEFGSDTAESAYNLQTTYSGGSFSVGVGSTSFRQDYVLAGVTAIPLTFSYSVVGGSPSGLGPPVLTYTSLGVKQSANLTSTPTAYYIDNGSSWSIASLFPNTSTEIWTTSGPDSGTVVSQTNVSLVYYHQYSLSAGYSVTGGGSPSAPMLTYTSMGRVQTLSLSTSSQSAWADVDTAYSATNPLGGSDASERWTSEGTNGTMTSPIVLNLVYNHEFLLTTVSLATTTAWLDAGTQVQQSVQEVFGRSNGEGYRVASASLDSGAPQPFEPSTGNVSFTLQMTGPHTLTYNIVKQYQVTLQSDAAKALFSITPPTITGDQYWYDAGSPVSIVLNGTWGRNSGAGNRLTAYSVDGGSVVRTSTIGAVSALNVSSISSPHSLAATIVTQYQLSTPTGSVVSVTPPPIQGDNGWYDSGSTVAISYATTWNVLPQQSRLEAAGYSVDGGSAAPVALTGNSTFTVSVTMGAPHVVEVGVATQYFIRFEVTDASGSKKINYSALQISVQGKTEDVPTQGIYVDNSTALTLFTLTYEGVDVSPNNFGQYLVSGPSNVQLKALVYDATLKATDLLGLPVSGATVKMTLANGSTISGKTSGDGTFTAADIPLGTYTANIYSLGFTTQVSSDASRQPVTNVVVPFSTPFLVLVVALVVVALAVSALVLRRRKRGGGPA